MSHSVGGICTIRWALFALVLSLHISLEALTKPKQGFSSRKGCVHPRSHTCTDSAHGIPKFTGWQIWKCEQQRCTAFLAHATAFSPPHVAVAASTHDQGIHQISRGASQMKEPPAAYHLSPPQ